MWVVTDVLDINFYGEQQIRESHKSDSLLQKCETYKCLKNVLHDLSNINVDIVEYDATIASCNHLSLQYS